jgi:hypothetical protein
MRTCLFLDQVRHISLNMVYPSIPAHSENLNYHIEHKLNQRFSITEKVDGANLWFTVTSGYNGENLLEYGSKSKKKINENKGYLYLLFKPVPCYTKGWPKAIALRLQSLDKIKFGYTYYGEAFNRSRTNTLNYHQTPRFYWIIYDIKNDQGMYHTTIRSRKKRNILVLSVYLQCIYMNQDMWIHSRLLRVSLTLSIENGWIHVLVVYQRALF